MRQNDRVTNGQAETNTGHGGVRRVVAAAKWLEDLLAVGRRDTRTSILDDELQLVLRRYAGRDVNRRVRWCVLDCVLQQIRQDTLYLTHVDAHGREVGGDIASHDTVCEYATHAVDGAVDHVRRVYQGHVCLDEAHPAGAAGGEEGFNQLGHPIGLELNLRQQFLMGLRVPLHVVAPQGADEPLDVAQGEP
jgi:hypothetical protein